MTNVRIETPSTDLREAFLRMLDDYAAHDPQNGEYYAAARIDFDAYVQRLCQEEQGIDLAPGMAPCSQRWLVNDSGACVAVVSIRHNIDTAFLANEAGHIGYDVAPSFRRQGYGLACLQAGLSEARQSGLARVLLFAVADNIASWKIIERCGGVLESEHLSTHYGVSVRRYWINSTYRFEFSTLRKWHDKNPSRKRSCHNVQLMT